MHFATEADDQIIRFENLGQSEISILGGLEFKANDGTWNGISASIKGELAVTGGVDMVFRTGEDEAHEALRIHKNDELE